MKRKNEKRTTKSRKKGKQTRLRLPPEIMGRIGYFRNPLHPNSQKEQKELEVLNKICPSLVQGFNKGKYERIRAGTRSFHDRKSHHEELDAVINDPEKAKYVKCLEYRGFQFDLPEFKNLKELEVYNLLPQKLLLSIPILDSIKCMHLGASTPVQMQELLKYQVDLRKESQNSNILSCYWGPINEKIAQYLDVLHTQAIKVKLVGANLALVIGYLKKVKSLEFECGNINNLDFTEAIPQIMELKNMKKFHFGVNSLKPVPSTFYDSLLHCVLIQNESTLVDFNIQFAYDTLNLNNSQLSFDCWKRAESQLYLSLANVCKQIQSSKALSSYRGPIKDEIAEYLEMRAPQTIDVELAGGNLSRVFKHLKTIQNINFKCENPNDSDLGEAVPQVLGLKSITTFCFHLSLKGPIEERRKLRNGPGFTKFYEALVNHAFPQNAPTIKIFHLQAKDASCIDEKLCMDKRPVLELSPDLHFPELSNLYLQFMPTVSKAAVNLIPNAPMLQTLHIQETLEDNRTYSAPYNC